MKGIAKKFFDGCVEALGLAIILWLAIVYYDPQATVFCGDIKRFEPAMTETAVYQKHCKDTDK